MHFTSLSSFKKPFPSGNFSCPMSESFLNFSERSKAQRTAKAPPSEWPVVTTVSIVGMRERISLRKGIICFCTASIRNHKKFSEQFFLIPVNISVLFFFSNYFGVILKLT